MNAFLAPLLPTLLTASLMLIGLALLWQRVNNLQDDVNNLRSDMNNLRSDMKDLRSDVKEGLERIERRFDKQQDLILALTDPARQSTAAKG